MPAQSARPYDSVKSLTELKTYYEKIPQKEVKLLCKGLPTVLEEAKRKGEEKDELGSYIFYMKFFNIYHYIISSKDYKKNKDALEKSFPKARLKKIMDSLEKISNSIQKRFEQDEEARSKKESANNKVQDVKPKPRSEKKDEPDEKRDTNDKIVVNGISSSTDSNVPPNKMELDGCISTLHLFKLLQPERTNQLGQKESVLILDTRPLKDFAESHMKFPECISVPEEIVLPGLTASKLAQKLSPVPGEMWKKRTDVDYLVLMDWSSNIGDLNSRSAVFRLRNILIEWDPGVTYRSKPLILDGGYEGWLDCYPTFVTNPKPLIPSRSTFNDLLNIDDVEYPNLIDETPTYSRSTKPSITTPTVFNKPALHPSITNETPSNDVKLTPEGTSAFSSQSALTSVPIIDRSSKAAALQKLKDQQAKISEHLEEINRDREALEALKLQQKSEQLGEELKQDLLTQEQKLKEDLESMRKLEAENESLKRQVEEYKKRELIAAVRQTSKPIPSLLNNGVKRDTSLEIRPGGDLDNSSRRSADQLFAEQQQKVTEGSVENKGPCGNDGDKGIDPTIPHPEPDPHPASSGMKRSRSSPNIAQLGLKCEDEQKFLAPHFDRTVKPVSTKPQNEIASRQRNFAHVYGNVGKGLTGLKNLGNSCYMNSILQCISNTSPLNKYFCSLKYEKDINRNPSNPTRGEVAEEVAHVVRNLWRGEYRSIACRDLKMVVGKYLEQFRGTIQQDSHEFLTFLMDWLHNDLKVRRGKVVQEVADSCTLNHHVKSDALTGATKAWNEFKKSNESFILTLFFVQQVSTVKCHHCLEESVTYEEPTSNLTLLLPSTSRCQLEDCLRLYTNGERISGYKCESCKEQQEATKKVDLWRLPPILVIHLKRFYSDGFYQKRQTFVDFPLTNLDMRKYTLDPDQRYTSYNLYGVSNHYGTLEGGHYTAYCKNNNQWYKFDDQDVSEISPQDVRSPYAYILFYAAVTSETPVLS